MVCPHCGVEIPEFSGFCNICGKEIVLVSDIELNIDEKIDENVKDAVLQVERLNSIRLKKRALIIKISVFSVLFIIAFICCFIVFLNAMHKKSPSYQALQGDRFFEKEEFDIARDFYYHALELNPVNPDYAFNLAECYFRLNDKDNYEKILNGIINNFDFRQTDIIAAYRKLLTLYLYYNDYASVNLLLRGCNIEDIVNDYDAYLSDMPEFSMKDGEIQYISKVDISAENDCVIFYTINGENPTAQSTRYSGPILLSEGDNTIKAIAINKNGISSDVAMLNVCVKLPAPYEPVVLTSGGDYYLPKMIEAKPYSKNDIIYYTLDGKVPDRNSEQYKGPIPMPIGKSTFKFVAYNDGRYSNIEIREYNFVIKSEITIEQAQRAVLLFCQTINNQSVCFVLDDEGHYNDTEDYKSFECQYCINLGEDEDYFVICVYNNKPNGRKTFLGNYFAVNAHDGSIYELYVDDEKTTYTLGVKYN